MEYLAKYPFTREASGYVAQLNINPVDLITERAYLNTRERGKARVFESLEFGLIQNKSSEHLTELLSYPFARIIVSLVNDRYLIRRYALAEAKRAYGFLINEDTNRLLEIAQRTFGLNVRLVEENLTLPFIFKMYFTDYLNLTENLRAIEWKLINRLLVKGHVLLRKREFARLISENLKRKTERELPLKLDRKLEAHYENIVQEVHRVLIERKPSMEVFLPKKAEIQSSPPCMKSLLGAVQAGENVPHQGRFAITAFLLNIGMKIDEIIQLYSAFPDFDEKKTRYQLEHICGLHGSHIKYAPPSCSTLKTFNLCLDPDELCQRIKHPLTYYKLKLSGTNG
ncbi:MAG: DNA primase large subunit PriL [Euryarchaeota archaeon]|nr:DNA primase large subunit PriL [Euryarchaeota archaeon]